ncbi:hypothetical protein BASA84_000873 [Batrachochytrium salamandrivorans]|nr:hypothetical protein BASA84_000873 [Batrachochytrium salamandrivorans]
MSNTTEPGTNCTVVASTVPLALITISDTSMIISIVGFFITMMFFTSWELNARLLLPNIASFAIIIELVCMMMANDQPVIVLNSATTYFMFNIIGWTIDMACRQMLAVFIFLRVIDLDAHFGSRVKTTYLRVLGWCILAYHVVTYCLYGLALCAGLYATQLSPESYVNLSLDLYIFGNPLSGIMEGYVASEIWRNKHDLQKEPLHKLDSYDINRTAICLFISSLLSLYSSLLVAFNLDPGFYHYFSMSVARIILMSIFNSSKVCFLLDLYTEELNIIRQGRGKVESYQGRKGSIVLGASILLEAVEQAKQDTSELSMAVKSGSPHQPITHISGTMLTTATSKHIAAYHTQSDIGSHVSNESLENIGTSIPNLSSTTTKFVN